MSSILVKNLKTEMERQNISALELAKRSEVKPSFVYDILHGKSANPSTTKLAKLANTLGSNVSQLLGIEENNTKCSHGNDYALISCNLVTETNENGTIIITEKQGDPYYFRRSWLRNRLNAEPDNLRMVHVEGDSMEPTLCHGDMILIDITKTNPSPPGIFVLFDGLALLAKRLEFIPQSTPPSLRILSDNPQYHPYERKLHETNIVGRVIWFAREI